MKVINKFIKYIINLPSSLIDWFSKSSSLQFSSTIIYFSVVLRFDNSQLNSKFTDS